MTRAVALAALLAGCQSLTDGARDEFSHALSCPKGDTEARERKDLTAYDVRHPTPPKPPADVAADPARLALWQTDQQDTRERTNRYETMIEVRGCHRSSLYYCTRANTGSSAGGVMCSDAPYPPGVAKW